MANVESHREQRESSKPYPYLLVPVLGIVLLASAALWIIGSSGKSGSFELDLIKQSFKVELGDQSHIAQLKAIMDNPEWQKDVQSVLRDSYGYHAITPNNTQVVTAIKQQPADSPLAIALRKLLHNLEGPFKADQHSFRNLNHSSIVDEINRLGRDHQATKGLREAAYSNPESPLFPVAEIGQFVKLEQLGDGTIGVCSNNNYKGETLNVFYNGESTTIAALSINCVSTASGRHLLVGNDEVEASFNSLFVSHRTAQLLFSGSTSNPIEAKVLLSRYMTQPIIPHGSLQLARYD